MTNQPSNISTRLESRKETILALGSYAHQSVVLDATYKILELSEASGIKYERFMENPHISLKELHDTGTQIHKNRFDEIKNLLKITSVSLVDGGIKSTESIRRKYHQSQLDEEDIRLLDLSRCRVICHGIQEVFDISKYLIDSLKIKGYKLCVVRTNYGEEGKYLTQFGGIGIFFVKKSHRKKGTDHEEAISQRLATEIQIYTENMVSVMELSDPRRGDLDTETNDALAIANFLDLQNYLMEQGEIEGPY